MFYGLGAAMAAQLQTDMEAHEAKKFLGAQPISADAVLEVRDFVRKFKGNFRQSLKVREQPGSNASGSIFTLSS
jgi:hypothetical protein